MGGQPCISTFDCFSYSLAPFTLGSKGGGGGRVQTRFGTLCGFFVSICLLALLAILAMPRVSLILSD